MPYSKISIGSPASHSDQCSREGCAIQYHRKPQEPTAKELKEQAERDAWRAKYPSVYAERLTKVSRTWDWFSSGRLSLGLYSIDWRDNYREFCKSFACHSSQDVQTKLDNCRGESQPLGYSSQRAPRDHVLLQGGARCSLLRYDYQGETLLSA